MRLISTYYPFEPASPGPSNGDAPDADVVAEPVAGEDMAGTAPTPNPVPARSKGRE